jgi:hypothetical protein
MGWTTEGSEFESRKGKIFLFSTSSRLALSFTQPPSQWVPGVKQPGHESNHSSPASAEIKNKWIYTSTSLISHHGDMLNQLSTGTTLPLSYNCGYGPHVIFSLTRGWVCRLELLLVLARVVIVGSESSGTHDHILITP